jgi:hypothetical protein
VTKALEGREGTASRPGRFLPPAKDPAPIVQEAGWAPGPVWTGVENLAPTGIRSITFLLSPDRFNGRILINLEDIYRVWVVAGGILYQLSG